MTMDEEKIQYVLGRLSSDDPKDRVNTLRGLAEAPLADGRVLEASEKLLEDRSITLLSIPYQFGEIRWHAAAAVAAIRGSLGITEPVVVKDILPPCSTDTIVRLAREAGLPKGAGGIDGVLESLRKLVDIGAVPRRTITRDP